jgi:hypothetical protein
MDATRRLPSSGRRRAPRLRAAALAAALSIAPGCMALTPQLAPTDFAELERVKDRDEREQAYADNAIYRHSEPQGIRYTKGTDRGAQKRSWQSLDKILRSDASASAALPRRQLRIARLFTALTIAASIVTVAGIAASAREGLDLKGLNGTGGLLLGGGLATLGFGITAGVFYGKSKKGYERAVEIYNDSLSVRLGINSPDGKYIPPAGAILDKDGNIMLEEPDRPEEPPEPEAPAEPAAPEPPASKLPPAEPPPPGEAGAAEPPPPSSDPAAPGALSLRFR